MIFIFRPCMYPSAKAVNFPTAKVDLFSSRRDEPFLIFGRFRSIDCLKRRGGDNLWFFKVYHFILRLTVPLRERWTSRVRPGNLQKCSSNSDTGHVVIFLYPDGGELVGGESLLLRIEFGSRSSSSLRSAPKTFWLAKTIKQLAKRGRSRPNKNQDPGEKIG